MDKDNHTPPPRLWNGEKKNVRLEMSFYGKSNSIHISKDAIRVIGAPPYICFKINREMDSIAVAPCKEQDILSFKVPEDIYFVHRVQMRVTSQSFVGGLMIRNGMEPLHTYKVNGTYLEKENAVVFHLADKQICAP